MGWMKKGADNHCASINDSAWDRLLARTTQAVCHKITWRQSGQTNSCGLWRGGAWWPVCRSSLTCEPENHGYVYGKRCWADTFFSRLNTILNVVMNYTETVIFVRPSTTGTSLISKAWIFCKIFLLIIYEFYHWKTDSPLLRFNALKAA